VNPASPMIFDGHRIFMNSIDLRRKYFIDPLTVGISAIINQITKDWLDILRIISSVDQVRTFAEGLMILLVGRNHASPLNGIIGFLHLL
jgi:hypothetical protein